MCSISEPDIAIKKAISKYTAPDGICVKCKIAKHEITIRQTSHCRPCFLASVNAKFRSTLAKDTISLLETGVSNAGSVAVLAYSGGSSSRTMLDILMEMDKIETGMKPSKRISKFIVCHVAEHVDCNQDVFREWADLNSPNFSFITVPVFKAFQTDTLCKSYSLVKHSNKSIYLQKAPSGDLDNDESEEKFTSFIAAFKSWTAKEQVLRNVRLSLLRQVAMENGASHILLGDSSTSIAINTFSNTAKGRGQSMASEIGSFRCLATGLSFVRCMRDIALAESEAYCSFKDLVVVRSSGVPESANSIQSLTRGFLLGLDKDYPMTVATIVRTVNKLALSTKEITSDQQFCMFCYCPIVYTSLDAFRRSMIDEAPNCQATVPSPVVDETIISIEGKVCFGCYQDCLADLSLGTLPLPGFVCSQILTEKH